MNLVPLVVHILLYARLCEGLEGYRGKIAIGQHPFEGGKIVAGVKDLVGALGLEPRTYWLKANYSTIELHAHYICN